jgi:hypothetical protein
MHPDPTEEAANESRAAEPGTNPGDSGRRRGEKVKKETKS